MRGDQDVLVIGRYEPPTRLESPRGRNPLAFGIGTRALERGMLIDPLENHFY